MHDAPWGPLGLKGGSRSSRSFHPISCTKNLRSGEGGAILTHGNLCGRCAMRAYTGVRRCKRATCQCGREHGKKRRALYQTGFRIQQLTSTCHRAVIVVCFVCWSYRHAPACGVHVQNLPGGVTANYSKAAAEH